MIREKHQSPSLCQRGCWQRTWRVFLLLGPPGWRVQGEESLEAIPVGTPRSATVTEGMGKTGREDPRNELFNRPRVVATLPKVIHPQSERFLDCPLLMGTPWEAITSAQDTKCVIKRIFGGTSTWNGTQSSLVHQTTNQ